MIRPLRVLAACLLLSASAHAQEPAADPPPPGAEQAKALAEMLKDDAAREALIARLLEVAEGPAAAAPVPAPDLGVVRALADTTREAAERFATMISATSRALVDVRALFEGDTGETLERTLALARDLAVVVAVTLALFFVLRFVATRLYRSLERRAEGAVWWRRLLLLLASSLADALCAVGAWAGGYGFALGFGEAGSMDVPQSLFLNAFLIIELVKVLVRAVLAPRFGALRLLPMGDETAAYWGFWSSRLVSLVGYGMMLVVPIVGARVSFGAGRAIAVLVALTALAITLVVVMQNRTAVRDALQARAARAPGRLESWVLSLLARTWHVVAIVYLLSLFGVWSAGGDYGVREMGWSTLQSVVAVMLGTLVVGFISRWISSGMHLSDEVRARLPLLEARLNAYVPAILKVVRLAVMVAVLVALAHIWGITDFLAWFEGEGGREVLLRFFSAFLIALFGLALYLAMSSWVEYRLNPDFGTAPTPRERTLLALFRNAFVIALVVITLMLVLAQLGVNIAPLLAGAGVLGLAIGFGAQKLVQDVITGAFIQLENAMNEGDVVTVGGITGAVERLTIRSVGLRDVNGVYHVIPFSSADSVSNFMKGFSYCVTEIGVAYRENVAEVKSLLQEAFDRLKETEHGEKIIAPLEVHGLTTFGDSAVNVRVRIKCMPGTQWAMGRAYNEIIKEIFDERGVEIPFPHVTLYMGADKDGSAPPLRIAGGQLPAPGSEAGGDAPPGAEPGAGTDDPDPGPAPQPQRA